MDEKEVKETEIEEIKEEVVQEPSSQEEIKEEPNTQEVEQEPSSQEEIKEEVIQEIVQEPSSQEEKKPKKKKGKFIGLGVLGLVGAIALGLGGHRFYKSKANEEVINYMRASYGYDVYYNHWKDTVDIVDYIVEKDLVADWETEGGLDKWRLVSC